MLYSPIAGSPYFEPADNPNLATFTQNAGTLNDVRMVARFATTAARDLAYAAAIAGTAPYSTPQKGMRCYVDAGSGGGYGDWCGFNGTEWLWDKPVPLWYTSSPMGSSFALNNTAFGGYAGCNYTFTPSRTGYANVGFSADVQEVTAGYLEIYLRPRFGGGLLLPGGDVTSAQLAPTLRTKTDISYPIPVRFTGGVPVTVTMDVACANAAGSWQFNDFKWKIVQF